MISSHYFCFLCVSHMKCVWKSDLEKYGVSRIVVFIITVCCYYHVPVLFCTFAWYCLELCSRITNQKETRPIFSPFISNIRIFTNFVLLNFCISQNQIYSHYEYLLIRVSIFLNGIFKYFFNDLHNYARNNSQRNRKIPSCF